MYKKLFDAARKLLDEHKCCHSRNESSRVGSVMVYGEEGDYSTNWQDGEQPTWLSILGIQTTGTEICREFDVGPMIDFDAQSSRYLAWLEHQPNIVSSLRLWICAPNLHAMNHLLQAWIFFNLQSVKLTLGNEED